MTAPAALPVVDWPTLLKAGYQAKYGLTVTVDAAPPLTQPIAECDCPDGHLWITLAQRCPCAGQP